MDVISDGLTKLRVSLGFIEQFNIWVWGTASLACTIVHTSFQEFFIQFMCFISIVTFS